MGSKTPEGHQQKPDGGSVNDQKPNIVAKPRNGTFPDDDLGGNDEESDGDDDDDNDEEVSHGMKVSGDTDKKKKRKRSKKKKKKTAGSNLKQSSPPRVLLSNLFPSREYPPGEIQTYDENLARVTGEEIRANDRMDSTFLNDYRQAAEVHRQVRQWATENVIKPGKSLSEIVEGIEDGVRALTGHQGMVPGDSLKAGMGFPTGLCLNNVGAHFTPNLGQKEVILKNDDVLKVDFGVHVNGRIVDSAFTVAFDPVYDNLLQAVKDATNTGIKHAGIDARMSDIGREIQEAMESYEVEIKGKIHPVKAVRNLTGHDIKQYRIHGDKQVPFIKNSSKQRMEEGEIFAIETFGTTGSGYLRDEAGVYGYGRNSDVSGAHLHHPAAKSLLKTIEENFGTLVFCRRYLDRLGVKNYLPAMRTLVSNGIVEDYAPLSDIKGSYVAQFEHTFLLRSSGKEVVSRGDDY